MKSILLTGNSWHDGAGPPADGPLRDDPDMQPIIRAAVQETNNIGRAKGITLPPTRSRRRSISSPTRHPP